MSMMVLSPKNGGTRKTNAGGKMNGFSKKKVFALAGTICLAALMLLACPTTTDNGGGWIPPPVGDGSAVFDPATGNITISWSPVLGAASYDITHRGSRFARDIVWVASVFAAEEEDGGFSFTHTPNCPRPVNPQRFENYYQITAWDEDGEELGNWTVSLRLSIFGPSVLFFDAAHDDMDDIRNEINRIHDEETWGLLPTSLGLRAQFGGRRYIIFFMPGDYELNGDLRIGFYTTVAGLGRFPSCVRLINTHVETIPHLPENNATQTFWRAIENVEITSGNFRWAVSQSAPARRMLVHAPTQHHFNMGWGSGGFIADSWFGGAVDGGSQQQWYTRHTHFAGSAMGGVNWNKTIQASTGNLPTDHSVGGPQHVTLISPNDAGGVTPVLRERPFLYVDDDGEFRVFVPAVRRNAEGISWNDGSGLPGMNAAALAHNDGMGPGESLDFLATFYVTRVEFEAPDRFVGRETAASLNAQLAQGRHIFFTPGRFDIEAPIVVSHPNTIILGKGFPALWPTRGNRDGVIFVQDVPGVTVAGLLFDTTDQSVYSITVGHTGANANHSDNPILLADLVVRQGGQFHLTANHVDISVLINSNNVIGDKLWIWRADHNGLPNGQNTIDWDINTSINGLVVLGDDVQMYGLFVEHYHQFNTLWLGERGRIFFYQNELPYDPQFQWMYMSHPTAEMPGGSILGWAQVKVGHNVQNFRAYGLGMYCVFIQTSADRPNGNLEPGLRLGSGIEVPHHPGVVITNAVITMIGTSGFNSGINSIINGAGGAVVNVFGTARMNSFANGVGVQGPLSTNAIPSTALPTEPAPKTHWVESLVINSGGIVTANPLGGLPCFSQQFPGTSWNQPVIQHPLNPRWNP